MWGRDVHAAVEADLRFGAIAKGGRKGLCAVAVALGFTIPGMSAQQVLPPAELGGLTLTNTAPQRVHVAQAQDASQLVVRIQQLEEQLRSQNGQIEGLTFQLTQLQELLSRMQAGYDARLQALEGGAAPAASAAQPDATSAPAEAPPTEIPEQGVQPLPGEAEFDPTFDDGSPEGQSADPLAGTNAQGGVDLSTGQPLDLSLPGEGGTDADASAQFAAGTAAMASGDYAFAEDQFSQFIELYPDSEQAGAAANYLGDALLQRQAFNEAADVLLEAYQKDPQGPLAAELLVKLGASISGAGERDVACRTFAQVETSFPSLSPEVAGRLASEKARAECPPA